MTIPKTITPPHSKQRQRGAALLIAMLLVVLGLVTLLTLRAGHKAPELEAQRKTAMALAQAKEALLGRAASNQSGSIPRPGVLPCPDTHAQGDPNEGIANTSCLANAIGRLPWRTLGLPDLRDGANERLWYKLSGNFRNTSGVKVNTSTNGTLMIGGAGPTFAAIVFAPGAPLSGQVRDSAHFNDFLAYLEGFVAATDTNFNNMPAQPINDRFMTVLPVEIKNWITPRVAAELRDALDAPTTPTPYPDTLPTLPTWIDNNGWTPLIAYRKVSDTSAELDFSAGGCATLYTYVFNAGATIFTRQGKC
jgi:hypothetical protein